MIIGIDGNEANVDKRLGVGEITYQLLLRFSKLKTSRPDLKFVIYLKDQLVESLPKTNTNWGYRVVTPGKMWTQWRLPMDLYLNKPKPDVFFTPTHYAPRFSPVPTVISIMDLAFLYFPELFKKRDLYKLKNWTSYSAKQAKKIITISNSSKFDIIREYNIAEDRIVVVYPGIKPVIKENLIASDMDKLKNKYKIGGNFILFVGTLQPRKNIVRLIEAFDRITSNELRIKDLELVVIGKKGWMYQEILDKPKESGIEDKVKFLEFVSDEELNVFYKNAICFVLPSLYEGFGLPVLEAMQHDCPVITSNVSSLPEAGGDAALYVDPEDVDDIAEKIVMLINDNKLRHDLIGRGRKQVAKFSWEKSAKETLKVLEEVGNK